MNKCNPKAEGQTLLNIYIYSYLQEPLLTSAGYLKFCYLVLTMWARGSVCLLEVNQLFVAVTLK